MKRHRAWLVSSSLAAVSLLVAGCAAPGEPAPPLLHAATVQTRLGEEAYLSGRVSEAVPALTEAVRLHLAAGDLPGAAGALLNLALAQRATGDVAAATATADRLRQITQGAAQQLRERGGKDVSANGLDEASTWLEALLALDRGDVATARMLTSSPMVKLPASSLWPGRLETLRAEIALKEAKFPEAIAHARTGRAAAGAAHDRAEEARALRLAGAAEIRAAQWIEARRDFLAAVRIEENLGGGTRMAGDLEQLAVISSQLGDPGEAQTYTERARAIAAARSH